MTDKEQSELNVLKQACREFMDAAITRKREHGWENVTMKQRLKELCINAELPALPC